MLSIGSPAAIGGDQRWARSGSPGMATRASRSRRPAGKVIVFDPWFGNPKSDMAAAQLERCDLLLVTHGHGDHFGDALAVASRLRPAWPCIHEMSLWLGRRLPGGADASTGMNKGGTVEARGLRVTMVHAEHSVATCTRAAASRSTWASRSASSWSWRTACRIYYAGDTDVFGDMALIREFHRPDIAFLPIGGHFTMGPWQAAMAVELLGVKTVVPIHWGTFPSSPARPTSCAAPFVSVGSTPRCWRWSPVSRCQSTGSWLRSS